MTIFIMRNWKQGNAPNILSEGNYNRKPNQDFSNFYLRQAFDETWYIVKIENIQSVHGGIPEYGN